MMTDFHTQKQPAQLMSSVSHCRGERRISALWSTLIPPTLPPPLCAAPASSQKCDALQCCTLRRLPSAVYIRTRARRKELLHHPALAGVLLISVKSELITVCVEDDDDLRVDCKLEPTSNKINSYEFSWSSGNKQTLINTNVSGSAAEAKFKGKSDVEELDPHGYRMTLRGFRDSLPHNTTYLCKISGANANITVERDQLARCSAVSVFLKSSCSWLVCLLLFFYHTHS
uniref:Thy-1 cell surface antigen n=1 Tax=Acanthochromis polyacanthus TaxID=80966 RepID=A0A3Q1GCH5_9TELE